MPVAPEGEGASVSGPLAEEDEATLLTEPELLRRQRASAVAALRACAGKVSGQGGAAELLGLKPTTLRSRLKAWRIDPRDYRAS